jgi:energy-coupling factor transporter ATP-binding protein EcfA2
MADRKTKKLQANGTAGRQRSHPTTGSYFISLELENVRCFSVSQKLDLSDGEGRPRQWTILLGENGTGKTTILQFLAGFEVITKESQEQGGASRYLRFILDRFFESETILRGPSSTRAEAKALFVDGSRIDSESKPPLYLVTMSVQKHGATYSGFQGNARPPVCFAYGAGRRIGNIVLDRSSTNDATESLFLDDARLINGEEWLLNLDYSASKPSSVQGMQKQRLEMVKEVLIKVLPDVLEIRFDASSGVRPTPAVEFKTPYGWVPLRQLGYGYRTMIAWIVDFASRMVERYPDSPDPLAEPAVVLVDEIDLHLHPKWQRELIGFLTERFPNTQFIVTAHSPLIVQAATDANIALLKREGDHVVIENHPETIRGWRVDQVLTSDLFGLETARPLDMEKLILKRKELLTKPRLTKGDKKALDEIEARIGPVPTGESFEQAKTMALIEKSLEILKKNQGIKA